MNTGIPMRCCLLAVLAVPNCLHAQGVTVTATIEMHAAGGQTRAMTEAHRRASTGTKSESVPNDSQATPQVVVWLTPLAVNATAVAPGHFRLVQKNKMFQPHLLVVPVGSTVAFPNLDPFFHNVFSLFNGKRFDLGLYETGATRDVHFNHEGVSFIFCNIHPEMSAVVLTLATPYFGESSADGRLEIHDVPAGTYRLGVWAEGVDTQRLEALDRVIDVGLSNENIGLLRVSRDVKPSPHKNKFGEKYTPSETIVY